MHQRSLRIRVIRKLFYFFSHRIFFRICNWRWLRLYPAIEPNPKFLTECTESNSEVYQKWLDKHALNSYPQWRDLHKQSVHITNPVRFSIITPVFNTDPGILEECIFSVRTQCYPFWELMLIDDGSDSLPTRSVLQSPVCQDPRIRVHLNKKSQGISAASNQGIESALGDYVLFLDHDDRLTPDALFHFAERLIRFPDTQIIYSDRDMITPEDDLCTMHLFKPGWSPEQLLSGNYLFHLVGYERQFLLQLGCLRSEFDGSQDYDLILRAVEKGPKVLHIATVLYHWRQHMQSVALNENAKDYAFAAGLNALRDCLERRGIHGSANEIQDLWRGNYQIHLDPVQHTQVLVVALPVDLAADAYTGYISEFIGKHLNGHVAIAIISDNLVGDSKHVEALAAWVQLDQVGLASPRIDTEQDTIFYAGWAFKQNAELISPYKGFPLEEPGYMAVNRITRNISAPHPYCVIIRADLWRSLHGFEQQFKGPHALLDFALRAKQNNWRSVIVPQYRMVSEDDDYLTQFLHYEQSRFYETWKSLLSSGDPYYNINLNPNSGDMGLDV